MIGFPLKISTAGRKGATPTPVSMRSDARSPTTSHAFDPWSGASAGSRMRKIRSGNAVISNQSMSGLRGRHAGFASQRESRAAARAQGSAGA